MPQALGDLIIDTVTDNTPAAGLVGIRAHKVGDLATAFYLCRPRDERGNFGYGNANAHYFVMDSYRGDAAVSGAYYELQVPYLTVEGIYLPPAFAGAFGDPNDHVVVTRQARDRGDGTVVTSKVRTRHAKPHGS